MIYYGSIASLVEREAWRLLYFFGEREESLFYSRLSDQTNAFTTRRFTKVCLLSGRFNASEIMCVEKRDTALKSAKVELL